MSYRTRDVNRSPTPEPNEQTEMTLEEKIRYQLYATGERDRLKQLLATKLEASGWKDDVKQRCKEFVAHKGRDNVSIDDIVKGVRHQGRGMVPDTIKVPPMQLSWCASSTLSCMQLIRRQSCWQRSRSSSSACDVEFDASLSAHAAVGALWQYAFRLRSKWSAFRLRSIRHAHDDKALGVPPCDRMHKRLTCSKRSLTYKPYRPIPAVPCLM